MPRGKKILMLGGALLIALAVGIGFSFHPWHSNSFGTAWAAPDSVDEAKAKSLEALEAITRALQDLAKKAQAEAQQAADQAREQVRTSLEKACDASLRACQKVCGDDAKCLNACKEGRRQCQS